MKFSVTLPSYIWPGMDYAMARTVVRDCARKAEALGFDSVTVWDHFVSAPGLYGSSWHDPLLCLSHAAAVTERIRLGTDILVLPIRHPLLLAREINTLDHLSGGRFFLGVGPGWNDPEFELMGMPRKERGARTDEGLEILTRLLTQKNVSWKGKFYSFENVTIDPVLPKMPEVWVAGGSRIKTSLSPDPEVIADTVLARIAKHADVFTLRASGNQELAKRDIQTVKDYCKKAGRTRPLTVAQVQAIWMIDSNDREECLRRQRPHFETMMGTHRDWHHLQGSYLTGTPDDIAKRLKDLESVGLEYIALHPAGPDITQLDLWKKHLFPAFGRK